MENSKKITIINKNFIQDVAMAEKKDTFVNVIKFDREKINDEMQKHPEDLYYFGRKYEVVWNKLAALELKLEETEALVASQYRNKYKRNKEKPSETAIKDMVKASTEIRELKQEVLKYKKLLRLAKLKMEVLKVKGEKMTNISHNIREEKKRTNINRT